MVVTAMAERYVVERQVGRGAMGVVFRAFDHELARPVALKRLHANQTVDARARLVREARAAAQLQHPNVVAVYEVAGDVLATEWIDGVTLRAWIASARRPWREVVAVVVGAGRGLAAAHAAGIVHRDFKPENVLVDRRNRARVADFGLASAFDVAEPTSVEPIAPLRVTVTGAVAGTPAYMAPELIDGARPDTRSDQFAFAVTLFEAVTGTYPFAGKTAEAIWAQMSAGVIAKHDARIPAWLERAMRKALSPDPMDRFASMDELLDLVERRSRRGIGFPVVAAGALGGIVVASVALLLAPSAAASVKCGDELVDEVWTPATRAAIGKQFTSVAPTRAAASLALADQHLDRWTGAWRLGRRAACAAEPALRRARTTCLDRHLGELRAQVAVWSHADASVVDRAATAVVALPSPTECAAAASLSPTPASADFINAIAELEALRRAGKFIEARAKIPALLSPATVQPDLVEKARAFFTFAWIEYDLREHALARAHITIAAQAARRSGDDHLLGEILILDGALRIVENHPAEALGVVDTIDSLSPRRTTQADVQAVRGEALGQLERFDEAIAAYRKGIALLEEESVRDPSIRLRIAGMTGAAGSMLSAAGRHVEGIAELERALAMEEAILGAEHPEIGRTLHDLAYAVMFSGDTAGALPYFERARAIFATAMGERSLEVATSEEGLADIALASGDRDRALQLATRVLDIYHSIDAEPARISGIETTLGNIEEERDRCDLALAHYERALASSKRAGYTGISLAIAHTNVATCLSELGRDPDARNAVEAALDAFDADPMRDPARSHAMAVLADLEARAGRYSHAIVLGEQVLAMIKDLEGPTWDPIRDRVTAGISRWRRGRA